ncbi:hypothetical protein GE061_015597 [Apolygus lucorum]|uniref:Nuclear pore complex protein Nup85 n=1 Tax=Apolygus lucorum TaxID=248454 RepID=A0A8S9XQI5_APOLU|nr:hypothetical protein GE061_015597 [Apolygus lucorum]
MVKEYVPTLQVPKHSDRNVGLTFKWAGHTGLAVHGFKNSRTEDGQVSDPNADDSVHFVCEGTILYDPEIRKLINESNATFIASRTIPRGADVRKRILELSREHRSSIRQCIENMQTKMKQKNNNMYENWVGVLDNIDHIWHVCELLHLDVIPGDIVLSKLLEWTRLHSSDYDLMVSEVITHSHTRGADIRYPNYWDMVIGSLIEGRFEACRALLRLHSEAESNALCEAEMLLRTIPLYSVYSGISVPEFTARWRGWKSTVRAKIDSGLFTSRPQLLKVMTLIGGEEPLYELLKPHCSTWYQMMTASLLLTEQTAKIHDLSYHAGQCIAHYGDPSSLKLLDHTLLALLDSNISAAIKKLQLTSDGGWCAVHLTNLLSLTGILSTPQGKGVDFEAMVLEYGQLLMSSQSFWQVGLTYLEHCRTSGLEVMRVSLMELPLSSEDVALRIVSAAKDYGLDDVVKSVCKIMGHQKLERENLAGALTWALLSNDSEMAGNIADKFLRSYARGCSEVEIGCASVLENLGQSTLISPRLTFLAKYCEFHSLYENGGVKEAAELLVRLLESKVSPKYFWLTLLSDALPLLEHSNPPLLSHDDTMIILACLEELMMDVADNIIELPPQFSKRTENLRIAIARNLATTILRESAFLSAPHNTIKCD